MQAADGRREDQALHRLRAYLAERDLPPDSKLPPERELAAEFGVSRADLRKALAVLVQDGVVWRHVGKGTFVGSGPSDATVEVGEIAARTAPLDMMRARLAIEPSIAREAALHATPDDIAEMRIAMANAKQATTWHQYEHFDDLFHRLIARGSRSTVLLGVSDMLLAVRTQVAWGLLRGGGLQHPSTEKSGLEHSAILEAIERRDRDAAEHAMRHHLSNVGRRVIPLFEDQD